MSVALLLVGDGRHDYRERTLASLTEQVDMATFSTVVEVDDSEHRLGFAGAVQHGWDRVLDTGAEWVAHVELDFLFLRPWPIDAIVGVLRQRPDLAQVCLKRQPVNAEECAAGGIVERFPDRYIDVEVGGCVIAENDVCFSTNPCVYSTGICRRGWPQVKHSEGVFTHQLLTEGFRFAFWGAKADPPRVEHIGDVRAGTGY